MSGSSVPAARRLAVVAALALACVAGCDTSNRYPADLTYPNRKDPIVVEPPGVERFYAIQPGKLEQSVLQIGVATEEGGPGGKALNPSDVPADKRQEVAAELSKVFGTPAAPSITVEGDEADDMTKTARAAIAELRLDATSLAAGSALYRRHCMYCHGVPGDGRGPTGPWVSPHPRDYRQGAFKFISTHPGKIKDNNARKPRREDLLRTLNSGVDGTTMPSFALLKAEELEHLVSYVIHLSLRGEVEIETLKPLLRKETMMMMEDGEPSTSDKATVATHTQVLTKLFLQRWADSNKALMEPLPYPYKPGTDTDEFRDSVARGYELFTNSTVEEHPKPLKGAGCIACHQDFGRQVNFKYDQWGTLVRPANLTTGALRGGRRPVDLYWRIRGGIIPSQMPLVELKVKEDGDELDGKKYWDLVNFVQALPYPQMLPDKVRDKVYPPAQQTSAADARHAAR